MVNLDILKRNLRIESFDVTEDDIINLYLQTAIEYVSAITGIANEEDSPRSFDMAVILLASHFYTNREVMTESGRVTVPYGFGMLMQNLKSVEALI